MTTMRKSEARNRARDEAKARVDCAQLAAALGMQQRGKGYWVCPRCQNPSEREGKLGTPKDGGWKCHSCSRKGPEVKGDQVNLVMHVEGVGLYEAINRLCSIACVPIEGGPQQFSDEDAQILANIQANAQRQQASAEPEFDAATWWQSHAVNAAPALALLSARGIRHADTRTPFVIVTPAARAQLHGKHQPWLQRVTGDVAAAPMCNVATGDVEGLHLRAIERQADTGDKRRTANAMTDEHGTPRGFGVMTDLDDAHTVMLCEGVLDVLACEALLYGVEGVAVVGGNGAGQLPDLAAYLAKAKPHARVVVCYHLDDTGTKAATAVREHIPSAYKLKWGALAKMLPPVAAMLERRGLTDGVDVCDILTAMHNARTPITIMHGYLSQTRHAFALAVGIPDTDSWEPPR